MTVPVYRTVPRVYGTFCDKNEKVYRTVPPSLEGVQRYTRCAKFQCKKKLDIYYSSVNILFLEIADLEKTSGDENEKYRILH